MATPEQCPECARFLSKSFVAGLAAADDECPKCGTTLTASMFGVAEASAPPAAGTTEVPPDRPAPKRIVAPDDESVRPPDVLEGWDEGSGAAAAPPEAGVVAIPAEAALAIGVVCATAGFVIGRRHPVWGAVLGTAAGVVAAVAGRTILQRDA